ncbi:MAG: acyl-CoA dehydrogenase family protein [Ignavibacteriales bacterium]
MDFNFSDEQLAAQKAAREFAAKEIAPIAREMDEKGEFNWDLWKKCAEVGFTGMYFPQEYGGAGMDLISCALIAEEISKVCASTALTLGAHHFLCGIPILMAGSEEQKQKYLPSLARGETIGGLGLTEPNAGTDAAGLQTRAEKRGDAYYLNGAKMFITNAPVGDVFFVLARTSKDGGHRGISAFIVEKDFPGLTRPKALKKMGHCASPTGELVFEDCRVPEENLVGPEGKGFGIAMQTLSYGRTLIPIMSLGLAEASLEESLKYARERKQFGLPIGTFQLIQAKLADMKVGIEAARMLILNALWKKEQGLDVTLEASMAKLFTSEMATRAALEAVQIHGGYGLMKEYPVERYLRNAKLGEIGEGTSELQRLIIANKILWS